MTDQIISNLEGKTLGKDEKIHAEEERNAYGGYASPTHGPWI
jgi:hypothetical protein